MILLLFFHCDSAAPFARSQTTATSLSPSKKKLTSLSLGLFFFLSLHLEKKNETVFIMKAMEVPVYRPTLKEMEAGLEAYVHRIEREGGRFATAGLAKIVPPAGWTPRRAGYNNRWDVTIDRPIK